MISIFKHCFTRTSIRQFVLGNEHTQLEFNTRLVLVVPIEVVLNLSRPVERGL